MFQQRYRPDNAMLTLIGEFDQTNARRLIERYFGPIVAPPLPLPRRTASSITLPSVRRLRVAAPVGPPRITFVWPGPQLGDPWGLPLFIALAAVDERIEKALGIVQPSPSPVATSQPRVGQQWFSWIEIKLSSIDESRSVEAHMEAIVRQLASTPISHDELERTRARMARSFAVSQKGFRAKAGPSLERKCSTTCNR